MTVSVLPAVVVAEPSPDAAPGLGPMPSRDAADPTGVLAVFPLLLQLLQQRAEGAPSLPASGAPAPDTGLVRGLLSGMTGPAGASAPSSDDADAVLGEGDEGRPEPVIANALVAPPIVPGAAPAVVASPDPLLGARPVPAAPAKAPEPAVAAVIPVPLEAPETIPQGKEPRASAMMGTNPTEATPRGEGAGDVEATFVVPARLDEAAARVGERTRPMQPEAAGSEGSAPRAEARMGGIASVAAAGRDETAGDAGRGSGSREEEARAAPPGTRVERSEGPMIRPDQDLRVARAASGAPAAAEATAPRPLVEQVVTRLTPLRQGRQEVSVRLDPPDLGSVRVEAVLDGQRLTLRITAEQESAKTLLEGALPRLRESLAQQGFVTGELTVGLGLDASARDFAGRGFARFDRPVSPDLPARAPAAALAAARWNPPGTDGLDLWA